MTRPLSFDDFIALRYLEQQGSTMTHHVARTLGYERVHGGSATRKARTLLRRLERWGYVAGERVSLHGNVLWYAITDAGREALA